MWRTRGHRPCRGPRCCSASRVIVRRAVKSQLNDGRVAADPPSSHVDESRAGFGLQVSIQHLRPPNIQHTLTSLHEPPATNGDDLSAFEFQERPAAGDGGESSCDCPASTSASASSRTLSDGSAGNGRWRSGSRALNSRDAAALTRRITHTRSTPELHSVVQQYRTQLNPIHIAAAIVKLAKLTAVESGRQRARHGLAPLPEQSQGGRWQAAVDGRQVTGAAAALDAASPVSVAGSAAQAAARDADAQRRRGDGQQDGPADRRNGSSSSDSTRGSVSESRFSSNSIDSSSSHASGARRPAGDSQPAANPPAPPDRRGGGSGPSQSLRCDSPRASASSSSSSSALLADLVSAFLCQLPHYSARQYANVVWALAAMGSRDHPELLAAAAMQLQAHGAAKLFAAPPQELSNLALGLAKLGYREVSLWGALIAAGKRRLHEFKPQELHNMAWAVAAASQDRSMISAAVQAALPRLRAFNASGLANMLWACAAAQCHCEELFDGAAAALIALPPGDLNCQDVANAAWACAKLQHNHPALMAHLARLVVLAAAPLPPGGSGPGLRAAATQELVNTLWAFAVLPPPRSLPPDLEGLQQASPGWRGGGGDGDGRGGAVGPGFVEGGVNGGGGGGVVGGLVVHEVAGRVGVLGSGSVPGGRGDVEGAADDPERPQQQPWRSHRLPVQSGQREPGAGSDSSTGSVTTVAAVAAPGGPQTHAGRGSSSTSDDGNGNAKNGGSLLEAAVGALVLELSWRQDLTPQGAANALWAVARLQPCALPSAGLAHLLEAASRSAHRMTDQELCNTLWAAGELRSTAGLFMPHAVVEPVFGVACAAPRLEAMAPVGLAQLVHAAVALRRVPTPHMDLLAQQVMARLPALGPQELCVLAVAVAEAVRVARYCNPILLNGLANAAVARVGELCPQGISVLLWSFVRAKHYHGPLTTALCRAAKPRLREFNDLELSNLVWALAVLKCQDRQLLVAAARVMVERVRMRRQRRAAAAAAGGGGGAAGRLQVQRRRWQLTERLFMVTDDEAEEEAAEGGAEERSRSGRDEMASLHRQQQQQRRRRQQQQQHRLQAAEVEPAVFAEGTVPSRLADAVGGGGVGLFEATTSLGPGLHAQGTQQQQQHAMESRDGILAADRVTVVMAATDRGTNTDADGVSGSAVAAAAAARLGVVPGYPGPAESSPSEPEAGLRLRRLPSLHHYHHHDDEADAPLQPRRPPPRDACGDGTAAGASLRCTVGAPDAAGGVLPPRSAASLSSTDDADSVGGAEDAAAAAAAAAAASMPLDHAKSMAKLLWSYAKCNLYNQSLFRLLAQELQPVLRHTTPHELALALWAVACHGHRCPELLDAAAVLLLRGGRLRQLCPWDASVVAWAYAKLGHKDAALFAALQQHAAAAGARYKEPCVLRLAWACAALEVPMREDLSRRVGELQHRARRHAAQSSYDGADGDAPPAANAARVE